jgi:AraC-like DNA-binding protein/quercetin dioxygenase-like cupin family protein
MKVEFEVIRPDEGSSFRLLHEKVIAEKYGWQYHFHPEYEIVCVLKGEGTRHVGNNVSHYDDGDLVFMGPNLPHAGFGLNAHGLHEEIVVQIKEEVFSQSILTRPEMSSIGALLDRGKHGICFTGPGKSRITQRMVRLLRLPPFEKYLELLTILQLMATTQDYQLLNPDTAISSNITKNNIRLQNIFSYVEQHFHEEIQIQRIAQVAHLSVPSFCTYFKKIMNSTFTDFVNQYRIQRACQMIQLEKTIYETCFACGFNSVAYFNKVFKEVTQKTPSAFRKEKLPALRPTASLT